jgi:hypothetical protein
MSSTPAHQGYNQAPTQQGQGQGQGGPYTNSHHAQNPNPNNNNNNNTSGVGTAAGDPQMNGDSDNSESLQFSLNNGFQTHCGCLECYHPVAETLDYDYTAFAAATNNGMSMSMSSSSKTQHPRIRERGEFYIDSFNDQPWSWSFGTNEMVCSLL